MGARTAVPSAPPVRDHEQAAEDRITVEALESHVWRLRDGFSRSERASWSESTFFGRRRRAAQQRGAIAAALHRADGALRLLERRAQGLRRGGENHREEHGERGDGPHGDRSRVSTGLTAARSN
jgi:hypothetical protein